MSDPIHIPIGGRALVLLTGDITLQEADAIVNAANSSLMGGGGVDGAIHRAGGPAILAECREYRKSHPPLPAGSAIATAAGELPARYVIHTVGPVWYGGNRGEPDTLARCHRETMRVADELKLASIAFPAISTGAFGYPVHLAAEIAVRSVTDALASGNYVQEVRFVLFDERTLAAFTRCAQQLTAKS